MTDAREAARHYWVARKSDLEAIMLEWAKSDVGRGIRSIPGFTITEEKVPV